MGSHLRRQQAQEPQGTRPDLIPNEIVRITLPTTIDTLLWIFNASLNTGYYPKRFRESTTVALKKPGKKLGEYSEVSGYRPIALLNTIGKVMEAVIATRMSALLETHQLLPVNHIGGRKGLSCELALHGMIADIHEAWRRQEVATLLSLDVSGAFDTVSHTRLIHNLSKRRLGGRWA